MRRLFPAILVAALIGCAENSTTPVGHLDPTESVSSQLVTIQLANRQELLDRIAASSGQVVLVDYWATWCDSCLRQLPHTIQLNRFYAENGFKVITVSLNETSEQTQVLDYLIASRAEMENLISINGSSQLSFDDFDIENGTIPFYQLYDRWGNLRRTYSGQPHGLEADLEQLLAETRPPTTDDEGSGEIRDESRFNLGESTPVLGDR